MYLINEIDSKLKRLISIMLTDGVQPGDLANNIFVDCYKSISYKKVDGQVIGELVFEEVVDDTARDVKLRYFYDTEGKIIRIEEEIFGNVQIEWDRELTQEILIKDIVELLRILCPEQVSKFIKTVPPHLKTLLEEEYQKTA
jgi:hypothetical protein